MVPSVRVKSLVIEIWMMLILMMLILMMILIMIMMMMLMIIMMMKPLDFDAEAHDDSHHKTDSYTAVGAAPGASVSCSLFIKHLNHKSQNKMANLT